MRRHQFTLKTLLCFVAFGCAMLAIITWRLGAIETLAVVMLISIWTVLGLDLPKSGRRANHGAQVDHHALPIAPTCQRFQFSLSTLLCLTTGIGLLFGAESALASLLVSDSRDFLRWFLVAVMMHVTMFVAGGAAIVWAVGTSAGRKYRCAACGAAIAALVILSRFVWFLSNPLNWFPGQQFH